MSRVRDIANILSANTSMATDAEVTSAISAQNMAGKNLIINGGFDFSQRGTGAILGQAYTLDRWYMDHYGTGTNGATAQIKTDAGQVGFSNYARISAGSATGTNINFTSSLETAEVRKLQGKTVTLSFKYKLGAPGWSTLWGASIYYSTNIDQNITSFASSGSIAVGGKQLTTATTWTSDSLTVTVPSNATSLNVYFSQSNNVISNATFDIAQVQLELGSTASTFSRAGGTLAGELAACQRYYYQTDSYVTGSYSSYNTGNFISSSFNFPVTMRATPSVLVVSDAAGNANKMTQYPLGGSAVSNITPPSAIILKTTHWFYEAGGTSNGSQGNGGAFSLRYNASAEL
jgi:hypothetical protein